MKIKTVENILKKKKNNICFFSGDSISTVESFDPIIGRWQVAERMRTLRSRVGVTVLKGKF